MCLIDRFKASACSRHRTHSTFANWPQKACERVHWGYIAKYPPFARIFTSIVPLKQTCFFYSLKKMYIFQSVSITFPSKLPPFPSLLTYVYNVSVCKALDVLFVLCMFSLKTKWLFFFFEISFLKINISDPATWILSKFKKVGGGQSFLFKVNKISIFSLYDLVWVWGSHVSEWEGKTVLQLKNHNCNTQSKFPKFWKEQEHTVCHNHATFGANMKPCFKFTFFLFELPYIENYLIEH